MPPKRGDAAPKKKAPARGKADKEGAKSKLDADVAAGRVRRWKEKHVDGAKMKNVHFTERENAQILKAYKQYLAESGLDYDTYTETVVSADKRGLAIAKKAFNRIAALAELPHRKTQSIANRLRRNLMDSQPWTEERLNHLTRLVMAQLSESSFLPPAEEAEVPPEESKAPKEEDREGSCTVYSGDTEWQGRISWTFVAQAMDTSDERVRSMWRRIMIKARRGQWNAEEESALRKGLLEVTGDMVPLGNVPWTKVQPYVPHRSMMQCMLHYYDVLAPRIVEWVSQLGVPIEGDVLDRYTVRRLVKLEEEELGLVCWGRVNKFLTPGMSRQRFLHLLILLPPDLREGELQEQLAFLEKALRTEEHKRRDRRLLRGAEMSAEWRERQKEMEEEGDNGVE